MFLPHIIKPVKVRNNSKTLTGNIFSNNLATDFISHNLTAKVSNYLLWFIIAPDIFLNSSSSKSNIYDRYFPKFDQEFNYVFLSWIIWQKIGSTSLKRKV